MKNSADHEVKVADIPSATVVQMYAPDDDPDLRAVEHEGETMEMMKKFIDDVDLFTIKPDARIYGWGDTRDGKRVYIMWATIPDNLEVPSAMTKEKFEGGAYAYSSEPSVSVGDWINTRSDYEWDRIKEHNQFMFEFENPADVFGKNFGENEVHLKQLLPVRAVRQWSEDEIAETVQKLDEQCQQGKTTEIDLGTLKKNRDFKSSYENGVLTITAHEEFFGFEGSETQQIFTVPVKIDLRAKTDSTDIVLRYAKGGITFQDMHLGDTLCVTDPVSGRDAFRNKCGGAVADEMMDIEWIIGRDVMVVKVNGEVRHISDDYAYIQAWKENPELTLASPVMVATMFAATVTVERLAVTEM